MLVQIADATAEVLSRPWFPLLTDWTLVGPKLHPFALAFLRTSCQIQPGRRVGIQLYVDGSGRNGQAKPAWAFAAFLVDDQCRHEFLGYAARYVATDPEDPWYLDGSASAQAAEVNAIVWALCWLSQLPAVWRSLPIVLGFDSMAPAMVTQGKWNDRKLGKCSEVAAALYNLVLAWWAAGWLHIKSHDGHPGNELVHSLCLAASSCDLVIRGSLRVWEEASLRWASASAISHRANPTWSRRRPPMSERAAPEGLHTFPVEAESGVCGGGDALAMRATCHLVASTTDLAGEICMRTSSILCARAVVASLRPAAGWTCRKAACVTTSLFCKEARQAARMATSRESSNRFATLDAALAACSKQAGVAMTSGVSC